MRSVADTSRLSILAALAGNSDAAATVDEKVGRDYGDYARRAADAVSDAAESLRSKDVETLYEDARALGTKSPAIAVGTAIVLGFAIARLARSAIPAAPERKDAA